jgi:hypothetical protein
MSEEVVSLIFEVWIYVFFTYVFFLFIRSLKKLDKKENNEK